MTRDKAKEFLPIIKAFSEGKTIQYKNSMMNGWSMAVKSLFEDWEFEDGTPFGKLVEE